MYAIWLLLSESDQKSVQKITQRLSLLHSSPCFLPHITLFGTIATKLQKLIAITDRCFLDQEIFRVSTSGVGESDNIWKTVFIEIIPSAPLKRLNGILAADLKQDRTYHFKPHISLIYKNMPLNQRQTIVKETGFAPNYEIAGSALVDVSGDVSGWSIQKQYGFRPANQ